MIKRKAQITDLPNTHFKLVIWSWLRNTTKQSWNFKWVPGYRIMKLPTDWTAVIENQLTGSSRQCNVTDLKLKLPEKDWLLKADNVGKAAKFVNHSDNLPDIDLLPDEKDTEPNEKHKGYMKKVCFLSNRTNFVERDKLLTGYSWLHQVLKKMFSIVNLYTHKVYQNMYV